MGILIFFFLPTFFISVNTFWYFFKRINLFPEYFNVILSFSVVFILPLFFLNLMDAGTDNSCCNDSAVFSPNHRLSVYVLIGLVMIAYSMHLLRQFIRTPLVIVFVDILFLLGFLFNLIFAFHVNLVEFLIGVLPLLLFFSQIIVERHFEMIDRVNKGELQTSSKLSEWLLVFFRKKIFNKLPLLFIFCIPFLTLFSLLMMLFGQKPDALILAFTETFHHGLSQWDYMCDNIVCGGHYLCSVAANGSPKIVKPVRYGERNGGRIICNRQLLVSNAFEEVILDRCPRIHSFIRYNYDKVGDIIHRNYKVYEKKWVSNSVYFLMKPLEWFFIFILYLVDEKPEVRISRQYQTRKFQNV